MRIFIGQNGVQSGPHTVETVTAKLADGSLRPGDLAWTDGEPSWTPLSEFAAKHGFATPPPMPNAAKPPPTEAAAHGRFSENAALLREADTRLAGHWWPTFGTLWLEGAIGGIVANLPFIGIFGQLLVAPVLQLGSQTYLMHRARPHAAPAELGMIFKPFNDFGRALGVVYYQVLWLTLWMLPFFVPTGLGVGMAVAEIAPAFRVFGGLLAGAGLIALAATLTVVALRYALYVMLALDTPQRPVAECLVESIRLMRGHKLRLWLLGLRALLAPTLAAMGLGMIAVLLIVSQASAGDAGAPPRPEVLLRLLGLICPLALLWVPVLVWLIRCSIRCRVAIVLFRDEREHLDRAGRS